jgi:hypothetical protein
MCVCGKCHVHLPCVMWHNARVRVAFGMRVFAWHVACACSRGILWHIMAYAHVASYVVWRVCAMCVCGMCGIWECARGCGMLHAPCACGKLTCGHVPCACVTYACVACVLVICHAACACAYVHVACGMRNMRMRRVCAMCHVRLHVYVRAMCEGGMCACSMGHVRVWYVSCARGCGIMWHVLK